MTEPIDTQKPQDRAEAPISASEAAERLAQVEAAGRARWSPKLAEGDEIELTELQEKFCNEYVAYPNATLAYKLAGGSERTANQQGPALLKHPRVKARIKQLQDELNFHVGLELADIDQMLLESYTEAVRTGNFTARGKFLELIGQRKAAFKMMSVKDEPSDTELIAKARSLGTAKGNALADVLEASSPEVGPDQPEGSQ